MLFLQEFSITFEGIFRRPVYLAALHDSEQEAVKFNSLQPKDNLSYSLCRTLFATNSNVRYGGESKRHYSLLNGNTDLS